MDRKEFLKMRKDILEEIEAVELKSKKLSNMIDDLKKEKVTVNEAYPKIIQACQQFLDGLVEEDKVKHGLKEFTKAGKEADIEMLISDIEKIQTDLQRELKEKNNSLTSVEKHLWKIVFEELKSKLHDQSRSLIEQVMVSAINARVSSDYNFLFDGLFGKYQRGPSQEMKNNFEKEVKAKW